MKIDMALATVEWLTKWHEEASKKFPGLYRNDKMDEKTAKMRYIYNELELYIHSEFSINDNQVVFYVGDLYRDAILKMMELEIVLPDGVAVLRGIEPDTYYEPYSGDEPSKRLEITFSTRKPGDTL